MKVTGNQRSILSFFGAPKASQGNDAKTSSSEVKKTKIVNDDSPIKKANRRSRVIESDSEDEEEIKVESEKSCENKENSSSNIDLPSPDDSIASSSTTSNNKIGFSAETVPPLRKTARKQMKRKSDALEDHQKEVVKKLKSSPSPKSPVSKKAQAEKKSGTPKANGHKRTNCLDMFVFKKTPRNSEPDSDLKETSSKVHEISNKEEHLGNDSLKKLSNNDTESSTKDDSDISNENSFNKVSKADTKSTSNKDSDNSATSNISTSKLEEDEEMEVDDSSESIGSDSPSKEKIASSDNIKSPEKSESSFENSTCESSPTSKKKSDSKVKSPKTELKNPFTQMKQDKTKSNEFNPSKIKYDPLEDASWKRNEEVPFSALSKTFKIIEETSGRLKTIEILSNFLRSVIILSPNDFLYCIYLCLSKVAPSFEGIELGIGEIYVCRAVAQVTGRAVNMIKNEISEKGDLGLVAEHSKSNQRMMFQPAPLTVKKVFNNLKEIALMSGQSSQNKKIDKIKSMFVACKDSEARFLIRLCGGKLRIGLAEQSVLQAIAQACFLTPPGQEFPPEILNAGKGLSADNFKAKVDEFANILKTTYCECPTFDSIVPVLLEKGMTELPNHCKLEPGIPLKPMLAHPTKGVSEVLKRFDKSKFTCEYKYDGERAQIHLKEDGTVSIFSRNQENNTTKYPDIIARLKNSLGADVKSCVLDSEAVAFDVNEKKILPFQILSTRKRKDANESEIKVQVCVFPFDLLYLNGRNLVTEPFQARRDLLHANFIEKEGQFTFAKSIDSTNTEDIEEFLEESIKGNCEGLMVKSLDVDATYEIAKRSRNWLKLKKDYLEGVGDTIDVVVIGGYSGKGKRMGTYGGFLIACYDPDNEEFQSLCKIGTGFTDEALQQHTTFLKEHVIENPKSYYRYDSSLNPDYWFDAVQVWEIKCADLSISPVHKAAIGIVDPEKGISLRFPRFLRIRDDKSPEDATSASQIADLYRNQDQIKNQTETNCEEDFY